MTPTREVYWNVRHVWLMYVLLIPTLVVFSYGFYRRYRLWRLGKPLARGGSVIARLKALFIYGLGQRRVYRGSSAGIFHLAYFAGFLVLFLGTVVVFLHEDLGLHLMQGYFYLFFQSLALDLFGLLATIGILFSAWRRYFLKPAALDSGWQDALILGGLFLILTTGFAIEGLRLAAVEDPWSNWSPVGLLAGRALAAAVSPSAVTSLHVFFWWFHLVLVFAFIAWLPYSKLLHIFTSLANIYFRSLGPKGAMLKPVDMVAESYGVNHMNQFTWKDLLDLDACTECGRCEEACPASFTGKPLSPKALITDLREHLHRSNAARWYGDEARASGSSSLIGTVIHEETLWSCTTCMACMEACPVFIEQVPKIIDMRRRLVMEEGRLQASMEQALRGLETRGQPHIGASASRLDWCAGLDVKVLSESRQTEYLYWVGCSTALDARNQKIARSFARLLERAGVDFAILGNTECCSGDPARRMGNEYLFEQVARRNIEILQSSSFKKIVTTCPHCFNTLKNEYPQLGGTFDVCHHSQLLSELIAAGRLKPSIRVEEAVTYHDPCYLGRYNDLYEEPRKIIAAAVPSGTTEMAQSRERSFCCGAGGGLMWAEESSPKRINYERARQALETKAPIIGVACPFCMNMMEDGVKSVGTGQEAKVFDIAELLDGANRF